jgi:hypothetical protein
MRLVLVPRTDMHMMAPNGGPAPALLGSRDDPSDFGERRMVRSRFVLLKPRRLDPEALD